MANMTFGTNLNPKTNNTYSLGTSSSKWQVHANSINDTSISSNGVMSGASSNGGGTAGLVPPPAQGDQTNKFLKADGLWAVPEGSRLYVVDLDDVTNTSGSYTHTTTGLTGVTTDYKAVMVECGDPSIFGDTINIETGIESITLSCDSVAGTSKVKVSLIMVGNANPLNSTEYGALDTRIGSLSDLHTTNKTSIVNAINENSDQIGTIGSNTFGSPVSLSVGTYTFDSDGYLAYYAPLGSGHYVFSSIWGSDESGGFGFRCVFHASENNYAALYVRKGMKVKISNIDGSGTYAKFYPFT